MYTDHVLVPYYNYEVKTKFLDEGITYDELSVEDKERYEEDFIEDGMLMAETDWEKRLSSPRISAMRSSFLSGSISSIRNTTGHLRRG